MNINLDSNGYVQVNNTYDTGNIDTLEVKLNTLLNRLSVYDVKTINKSVDIMLKEYPRLTSFNDMLNKWTDVLNRADL